MNKKLSSCQVCLIEGIEKFNTAYLEGTKKKNDIIKELGIDNYAWYNHINKHVKPMLLTKVDDIAPELAEQYIDKMGSLLQLLEREKEKALEITEQISASSDPRMINAWIGVNAEIRKTIETIAKLQGDLTTHSTVTHNNLTINLKEISEHIIQESCMKCKVKFADSLPGIIKKIEG